MGYVTNRNTQEKSIAFVGYKETQPVVDMNNVLRRCPLDPWPSAHTAAGDT